MSEGEIKYTFGKVTVTTQVDSGQDCGIVEIPQLGLTVNGAWDWGPHNPRKPGLLGILLGARQALGGYFIEHVKGESKNYAMGVEQIDHILNLYVLGNIELQDNRDSAYLTTQVQHNGIHYDIRRTCEFKIIREFGGVFRQLGIALSWKADNSPEKLGVRIVLRNAEIEEYLKGRTTEELALDYITRFIAEK